MILYFIITIVLGVYLYYIRQNRTKVPPGMKTLPIEKGLPVIGVLKDIKGPLCNYLTELGKKHGGMYLIRFGMRNVLVLNSIEYMKAALVDNGEAFSGRWHLYKYIIMSNGYGILHTEGNVWSEQRSYLMKTLKEFGIGRSRSVEIVQDECICLLKDMEEMKSKAIEFPTFVSLYTANVISKFIMNKRFTHEDREVKIVEETMSVIADTKDAVINFALMFPLLDKLEWFMKFLVWITSRKALISSSHRIFEKELKERLKTQDFKSHSDDLMDRYLSKQHQMKEKDGSEGTFTNQQLIVSVFELFIAGYDTTSSALTWSFMFMAMYPDIQKKVYEEISGQIGTERLPTMSDKPSLVYTQAVMDEIMRLSTVVPLTAIHKTLKSTCVNGYFIPSGTMVIPNIFACHVDPSKWEKPLDFYPEHFLSTDENGCLKYRPREELVTFSMGKRQCLGESLAKTEYFIFYVSVLQRFHVSFPEEMSKGASLDIFQAGDGFVRHACYTKFVFKKKNWKSLN